MIHYYKIPDDGVFEVRYNLSELRFLIGLVDTNKPEVARAIRAGRDYDDILENVIKEYKYKDWTNFKARVLEQARKEMEKSELSEIYFEYKPIRQHRGGKTTGVIFHIGKKGNIRPPEKILDIVSSEDINELMTYSNGDIENVDAETLLKAAGNDIEKVKTVYREYKRRNGISNPIGWMLKAITENWIFVDAKQRDAKPEKKTSASNNRFNNFEQRDYDYEELERLMLAKTTKADTNAESIEAPIENTVEEDEQIEGQLNLSDFIHPKEETEKREEEIDESDIDNMSIEELKQLLKKQTRKKKNM